MDACIGEMMAVARADAYFRVVQKGNFFFKIFDGFLKRQFGWMSQGVARHTHTPCHPVPYLTHTHTHAALPHTLTHTCGINRLWIRQGMQSRAARAASSVVRERSLEVRV